MSGLYLTDSIFDGCSIDLVAIQPQGGYDRSVEVDTVVLKGLYGFHRLAVRHNCSRKLLLQLMVLVSDLYFSFLPSSYPSLAVSP